MTSLVPPPPPGPLPWQLPPRRELDAFAISSFVCGLTCCAGPAAVGLGIAGMVRTRGGRRRGRWAAVTGLVTGTLGTLALIACGITLVVTTVDDLSAADARAGQCVDIDFLDAPGSVSCTEPHDGEVVWAGTMTDALVQEWERTELLDEFCLARDLPPAYQDAILDPDLTVDYWTDSFSGDPKPGEPMYCYVHTVGAPLTAPILGPGSR